jgi:predicted nucleotidyltransferase
MLRGFAMLTKKTIEILKDKAAKYKVKKLLLFGSCLEKSEVEAGDIDLAVQMNRELFLSFHSELFWDKDINKNIDLVDLDGDIPIMPLILENNMVIYEA